MVGKLKTLTDEDYSFSKIPLRYKNVKFSNIPDSMPYKEKIKKYLDNLETYSRAGLGLYLFSNKHSTGKTAIAVMVLRHALRLRKIGLFVNCNELITSVVNRVNYDEGVSLFDRAKQVEILVIDDFGGEYRTESGYALNMLEDIIRYRVQEMKTTIITSTNIPPSKIKVAYSEALSSLLQESCTIIGVDGMDWCDKLKTEIANMLEG